MTNKHLVYPDHAVDRMRERGIRRPDVRWLLERGIRSVEPTFSGAQRFGSRGYLGKREAKVIFLEDATHIVIVTVEWTDE